MFTMGADGHHICYYSLDLKPLPEFSDRSILVDIPRPKRYNEMLEYRRRLSEPFPFVRVDLYDLGDEIKISELTFTPGDSLSLEGDRKMGEFLHLERMNEYKRK